MNDYETIQKHINEAKLQRSVYLAELLASTIIAGIELVKIVITQTKNIAHSVFKGAQTRLDRSIFTFDA